MAGSSGRDGGQIEPLAFMLRQQIERPPHAAQHAQAQHVDLHEAQRVDVVLVPLDDLAVVHAGRLDRHQVVQPVLGQHETAGMLRQVPGKADQRARQVQRQAQPAVLQVEVQFGGVFLVDAFLAPAPDLGGQRAGDVLGQAHRLADVAHRATAAIADHRGAERGAVAAIGVVDPLDDFLAPLMFEIDVDVGRFPALGTDETFEQQAGAGGIDRGDAEHVAHRRIGGGPAALAQDALRAGEPDDAVHREEIRRVFQLRDQIEFVMELLRDVVRHAVRIAPWRRLPRSVVPASAARSGRGCGPRAGTGSAVRPGRTGNDRRSPACGRRRPGWRANSRAISSGDFRWRIAERSRR